MQFSVPGRRARRRGRWTVAACLVAMLAVPAFAQAKGTPRSIVIGPLRAAHGYQFFLEATCGAKPSGFISYTKGSRSSITSFTYADSVTCSVAPRAVWLTANWPGVASISLTGTTHGRAVRGKLPAGCHGNPVSELPAPMAGNITVTANRYFGALRARHISAALASSGALRCGTVASRAPQLNALYAHNGFVLATEDGRTADVLVSRTSQVKGVSESASDDIYSARLIRFTRTGVTIARGGAIRSGLVARAAPACIGDTTRARNVDLTGTLSVLLPVVGTLSFDPSTVQLASFGPANATFPSQCDGAGSKPLTPKVDNECSSPGVCTIGTGFNNDTFYDTSDPGTQKIVSETINFGDGTTGTFANSQATHTYTRPGNYTATVTIKVNSGQTYTTATPVYVSA